MSGIKTGTRRAKALRKSVFMTFMSGSRSHRGSVDSTSVAPNVPPSTDLISWAAALTMGTSAMEPGGYTMDSRITPIRVPFSVPEAPESLMWEA